MTFSNWPEQIHNEPDQQKRIKSAKDAKLTPISIDYSLKTGFFSGSSGKYITSLDTCQCGDFMRRRKPCKHIYRLAMETGLFSAEGLKSDSAAIVSPKPTPLQREQIYYDVIAFLESTDDYSQNEIKRVLFYDYKQEPYLCIDTRPIQVFIEKRFVKIEKDYLLLIKSNTQRETIDRLNEAGYAFPDGVTKKKDRYLWCLEHPDDVGPVAYPWFGALRPSGDLQLVKRKVYSYLKEKFDFDGIYFDI